MHWRWTSGKSYNNYWWLKTCHSTLAIYKMTCKRVFWPLCNKITLLFLGTIKYWTRLCSLDEICKKWFYAKTIWLEDQIFNENFTTRLFSLFIWFSFQWICLLTEFQLINQYSLHSYVFNKLNKQSPYI